MSNVINFNEKRLRIPNSKEDYLNICKKRLTEQYYRDILCGIMDYDIYKQIHPKLQKVVDCYYALPR